MLIHNVTLPDATLCSKFNYRRAFARWEDNPCIHVLGSHTAPRVPIFSFLTLHPITGKLIHHNFISTLLSDLYGIQARGGCACAGPYAEVSLLDKFSNTYNGRSHFNNGLNDFFKCVCTP